MLDSNGSSKESAKSCSRRMAEQSCFHVFRHWSREEPRSGCGEAERYLFRSVVSVTKKKKKRRKIKSKEGADSKGNDAKLAKIEARASGAIGGWDPFATFADGCGDEEKNTPTVNNKQQNKPSHELAACSSVRI